MREYMGVSNKGPERLFGCCLEARIHHQPVPSLEKHPFACMIFGVGSLRLRETRRRSIGVAPEAVLSLKLHRVWLLFWGDPSN